MCSLSPEANPAEALMHHSLDTALTPETTLRGRVWGALGLGLRLCWLNLDWGFLKSPQPLC